MQLEARLIAIEYLLQHLFKVTYRLAGLGTEHVAKSHQSIRETLEKETFPELDPAMSDFAAAEISQEVERLLNGIEVNLGMRKPEAG